jgi:predicted pyridoxine 5'-phosphate oxidase superfamily flavin-nucleotide-binding protein
MTDDIRASLPFHSGEWEAQMRFNTDWDERQASRLGRIIGRAIDDEKALFIEGLPFFFLATADADGHCDCSFRGTEPALDGRPLPVVRVTDPQRLLFPDYAGNRMFNSLGNIIANPHVGMLFIDFASQTRLRVNGAARILGNGDDWKRHWPEAKRAVEVTVEQVYWNCSKRIPKRP